MAVRIAEVKKKSLDGHRPPNDGLTGMGRNTMKHFIDVKQKMNDYIAQQELYYDQTYVQRDNPHFDLPMLDQQKQPRSSKPSSTRPSSSSRPPTKSTTIHQGHKKSSPKSHIVK